LKPFKVEPFLQKLDHCRFEVGYYDENKNPIFTQLDKFQEFDKEFLNKVRVVIV